MFYRTLYGWQEVGYHPGRWTIHPRTHIAPVADRLIHLSPCSASILAAAHR